MKVIVSWLPDEEFRYEVDELFAAFSVDDAFNFVGGGFKWIYKGSCWVTEEIGRLVYQNDGRLLAEVGKYMVFID